MKEERITSRQNPLLQHTKKLLSSRSWRKKSGEFAAEGTKLLEEAVKWYPGLKTVIAADGAEICVLPDSVRLVRVPETVFASISTMESPQGVIFLCDLPEEKEARLQPGTLLLDGIQDPGNLGTMIRTADALGVCLCLLDGCADPYSAKTVRASMGAVFRREIYQLTAEQALRKCKEAAIPLYATAMSGDSKDLRSVPLAKSAVIIGSEGQGVRQSLLDGADGKIIIPMNERCESLNAAAAATIVMWQMIQ